MQNGATTFETSLVICDPVKYSLTIWIFTIAFPLLGICPEEVKTCVDTNLYMNVYSSSIHNCQEMKITQIPFNWRMDKRMVWYVYTTESHSAIKKNELLIHATTWMHLKGISWSERSQSQKMTYHEVPDIWHSQRDKTIMIENSWVIARD